MNIKQCTLRKSRYKIDHIFSKSWLNARKSARKCALAGRIISVLSIPPIFITACLAVNHSVTPCAVIIASRMSSDCSAPHRRQANGIIIMYVMFH